MNRSDRCNYLETVGKFHRRTAFKFSSLISETPKKSVSIIIKDERRRQNWQHCIHSRLLLRSAVRLITFIHVHIRWTLVATLLMKFFSIFLGFSMLLHWFSSFDKNDKKFASRFSIDAFDDKKFDENFFFVADWPNETCAIIRVHN